jgi:hypothetical protein
VRLSGARLAEAGVCCLDREAARLRGRGIHGRLVKGDIMKIPEHLRAPVIVFALQAALLIGTSLVFLVLRP